MLIPLMPMKSLVTRFRRCATPQTEWKSLKGTCLVVQRSRISSFNMQVMPQSLPTMFDVPFVEIETSFSNDGPYSRILFNSQWAISLPVNRWNTSKTEAFGRLCLRKWNVQNTRRGVRSELMPSLWQERRKNTRPCAVCKVVSSLVGLWDSVSHM